MTQNGKIAEVLKESRKSWISKSGMEKSRKYLGIQTTISSRNQFTMPLRLTREMGLRRGDKIGFSWMMTGKNHLKIAGDVKREGKRLLAFRLIVKPVRGNH